VRPRLRGRPPQSIRRIVESNVSIASSTGSRVRIIAAMSGPGTDRPQQAEPIRVFIVDDHGMVRRGMRSYLSIFDDIDVTGEAAGGREALDRLYAMAAAGEAPDVVLMDLAMAPVDGVAATRELRAALPEVEIVAVTSLIDQSRVRAALEAGASGYLVKDAAPEELALAIRAAHRGEVHLDAALVRGLVDSLHPAPDIAPGRFDDLSERELEILRLIAGGLANKEIARRLVISERTARTHVSTILRKLGLSSRTQAALLAVREGLTAVPQP
jgi:DNA-binding NarL/FixJ family response regulator